MPIYLILLTILLVWLHFPLLFARSLMQGNWQSDSCIQVGSITGSIPSSLGSLTGLQQLNVYVSVGSCDAVLDPSGTWLAVVGTRKGLYALGPVLLVNDGV